jgi:hypothetical protein
MRTRTWTALFLISAAACSSSDSRDSAPASTVTRGSEGRIEFSSSRCIECPLIPFMAGGEQTISLDPIDGSKDGMMLDKAANLQFASGDLAVYTVKTSLWTQSTNNGVPQRGVNLNVTALKAGVAELRVLDGAGALLDRVNIEVQDPVRLTIGNEDYEPSAEVTIARSVKSVKVTGLAYGAADVLLDADEGFRFTSGDESIATITASCTTFICFGSTGNNVYVVPNAVGKTTVKVETANGLSASVPLTITP